MTKVLPRPLACAVLVVFFASGAAAQDKLLTWAQFRGPGGQGISAERGLLDKWTADSVVWKVDLPGQGASSPIVVGERILLTCYAGDFKDPQRQVVCLKRNSGELLWKRDVASKLPEQERIREEHGYATNTPVSDGQNVYVFFGKSGVHAFDLSGKPLWEADVGDGLNGWGSGTSPILHGDLLIVNASVESESVVALNKKTGKEVWRIKKIPEAWNTPVLVTTADKQTELVVAVPQKIKSYDPDSGKELWTCDTGIGWYMAPSLAVANGVVYCVGGRSNDALAVKAGGRGDVTETHKLWSVKKGSNVPSPVFYQGHMYWANDNTGIAFCAKADTGEIVYEERLPRAGQVYASPIIADGKLYYFARDGKGFVLPAAPRFELLATNASLEPRGVWDSTPAVADGRILVRSKKTLYAIGAK